MFNLDFFDCDLRLRGFLVSLFESDYFCFLSIELEVNSNSDENDASGEENRCSVEVPDIN